jgi:hypothetical protein
MAISHEPYCDQSHSPRQRCNDALAPGAEALNDLAPAPPPEPEPEAPVPVEPIDVTPPPEASPLLREAVVAGAMPAPSPYATRAWEETVRALDAEAWHETAPEDDAHAASRRQVLPPIALAGAAALALGLLLWLRRHFR